MADKESLEKLSDMYSQAMKLIEEYNKLAKKNKADKRIGLATSNVYIDDLLHDELYDEADEKGLVGQEAEKYVDAHINERRESIDIDDCVYERLNPSVGIDSPEADAWFPSAICVGY